jgi:hypothetical protein
MNVQYIKQDELRNVWQYIKPGLEVILKKSPESALIRGVKAGIARLRR